MDFSGKKVLVIGTGISGIAACKLLAKNGVDFVLNDSNEKLDLAELRAKADILKNADIRLGNLSDEEIKEFAYVVLSPGVPTDAPMVNALRAAGATISGEIELAYLFSKGDVVAITGTNGKTTTTTLVGEIMKAYNADSRVVGNIGIPYTDSVDNMTDNTITVAEISSFQLETIHTFAPKVSAILNITPDHLNRHHTMENYIQTKEDITKFQSADDICVLNYEDEVLRKFGEELDGKVKVVFFSSKRAMEKGLFLEDGVIYSTMTGEKVRVIGVKEQSLLGEHNYENVMAAVAMTLGYGVPLDTIVDVVKKFVAVEHRIEFVREFEGVRYYNDSKGTNPDASIKAVLAMEGPVVLIGGGYDKASDFDEWVSTFPGRVKKIVLIGVTAEKIAASCDKIGFKDYVFAKTFDEAIDMCREASEAGDYVLLSPACASWDMFKSYEQRGRDFKDRVNSFK